MKPLRIVFLCSGHEMSAAYFRPFFLGKYLVKRGHSVSLIGSSRRATSKIYKRVVDGVDVILLPSFIKQFFDPSLTRPLLRVFSTFVQIPLNCVFETISECDLLHSFDVMFPQNATPTLLSKIARSLGIHKRRIFVDWDDWWGHGGLLSLYGGSFSLLAPALEFLEEKVPLYADGVTVITEALRQRALRIGVKSQNLFLLPNGANVDWIKHTEMREARGKLGLPMDRVICTQVGVLDDGAFRLLIKAYRQVVESFPEALLMFVGKIHSEHLNSIESLEMPDNIIYVGVQPDETYPLYLSASDLFVLPLQDTIFDRARHHVRLGDYLAAGRPIVTTDLPQMRKIVGKCGLLANADPRDFADKMLSLMTDSNLRKELGIRARRLAETEYSWQIIAKRLEQMYDHYL